jgi:hypothetical protein
VSDNHNKQCGVFLRLSNVELCMQPMCNSCKCYSPQLFECKPPICPRIKEKAPLLSEVVCVTQPYALLMWSHACKCKPPICPQIKEKAPLLSEVVCISVTQPYALLKCSPACKLCVTHASVAPHMAELIHPLGHTIIISPPFKHDHVKKV